MLCITHDVSDTLDFDRVLVVEDGLTQYLSAEPSSRYCALLESEEQVRAQFRNHPMWQRLRMAHRELSEEVHASQ